MASNLTEITQKISEEFEELTEANRSLERRLLQLEEVGWQRLYGDLDTSEGVSLSVLKDLTKDLVDMSVTSPLITRAIELRHGYVFGKGIHVEATSHVMNVLSDPYNRDAVFSPQAFLTMMQALDSTGSIFVLKTEDKFIQVPLAEITGVVTDDYDNARIHYLQRTWYNSEGEQIIRWIPLSRYKASVKGKIRATIKDTPVDKNAVMYFCAHKRPPGWTFGVPTALPAKSWLVQYTEYLHNNSLLVKALSRIAWKVVSSSPKGAAKASAELVSDGSGTAGTANLGGGQDIQAVSRGTDVNFNNGQPLAAMVATSFGVPVIALLSSPGATGGSYGAATTLDEPTTKIMAALQESFKNFLTEIYDDIRKTSEKTVVSFPPMSSDANYRVAQALANLFATGALHQAEYREMALQLFPPDKVVAGLPGPNGFNSWSDPTEDKSDPIARQGNSGAVPGGTDNGDTNHDNDVE